MEKIIECDRITHYYGNRLIYADLSFEVEKGKVLGLLGKNGTGKTTIINILNGYLKPRSGVCRLLLHKPVREIMDHFKRFRFRATHPDVTWTGDSDFWNPSSLGGKWEVYSFLSEEEVAGRLASWGIKELVAEKLSLEDAFIGLTGKY